MSLKVFLTRLWGLAVWFLLLLKCGEAMAGTCGVLSNLQWAVGQEVRYRVTITAPGFAPTTSTARIAIAGRDPGFGNFWLEDSELASTGANLVTLGYRLLPFDDQRFLLYHLGEHELIGSRALLRRVAAERATAQGFILLSEDPLLEATEILSHAVCSQEQVTVAAGSFFTNKVTLSRRKAGPAKLRGGAPLLLVGLGLGDIEEESLVFWMSDQVPVMQLVKMERTLKLSVRKGKKDKGKGSKDKPEKHKEIVAWSMTMELVATNPSGAVPFIDGKPVVVLPYQPGGQK